MYQIGLRKGLEVSHGYQDIFAGRRREAEEKRTWMLSWINRQSSVVTVSDWFGEHKVERDLPPNIREMGDSTGLAYLRPCKLPTSNSAVEDN